MNYFLQEFNQQQTRFGQFLFDMERRLREQAKNDTIPAENFVSRWDAFLQIVDFYKCSCMAVASLCEELHDTGTVRAENDRLKLRLSLLLEQARSYGLDTRLLEWAKESDLNYYKKLN